MPNDDFPITPSTKIAGLLDHYPELEDVLIGIAPPFKKLKNPFLRKSVAKVASIRQAAAVARLPVAEVVDKLRAAVGQKPMAADEGGETASYFSERPEWFDAGRVTASIDERGREDEDEMPLNEVLRQATRLQEKEILELITDYLPAPGIDIMKAKGFLVWCVEEEPALVKTYFSKPAP